MHRQTNGRRSWLLLMFVCAANLLLFGVQADAQSRSSLTRQLKSIEGRKSAVRSRLRDAKNDQLNARNKLVVAQRDLAQAERELRVAEQRLEQTRATIRRVKAELAATEATLCRHTAELQQRVVVTYKAGVPSYLEVLLNATDFNDFATRADFNRRIAAEDTRLLQAMLDYQDLRQKQEQQLRSTECEQVSLRREVTQQRDQVAKKKAVASQMLAKATSDRATLECQLAEMEAASKSIEGMLAKLPSGTGQAGSYQGKWAGTFSWPLRGRLTSPFGYRMHPILGYRKMHTGIDIAAPGGTPIKAAAAGRVVHAGWKGAYGVCVIIDHGSGMSTVYGHMRSGSLKVSSGQVVSRGQVIGGCGTTGLSTGNHLHFEVRTNGRLVNPMGYL